MKKVLAVLLVGALFFVSCERDDPAANRTHLVVAASAFPASIDTTRSNDVNSSLVNRQYAETLVIFDSADEWNIVPHLATSWEMPDPQTLIMHLRRGVLFHNGDEMRASDVAFSLMRGVNAPIVRFILEPIKSVDIIDDFTVRINLHSPHVPILGHLTHLGSAIVSERAVREMGDDFANSPVGTGPFKFYSMSLGQSVELVRFEDYWGPLSGVERITFLTIPEAASRLIEVETGAAHIAIGVSPHHFSRLQSDPNLAYYRAMTLRNHHMGFFVESGPLADIRVRQAINHTIDVDAIVDSISLGLGQRITGPLVGIEGIVDFPPAEINLDLARRLMAEAGHAGGLTLSLWVNAGNQLETDMAVIIRNMLAEIGINVEIEAVAFATWAAGTTAGAHDMFLHNWGNVTADPDYGLMIYHENAIGGANRFFYRNPELNRLLDAGRAELDPAERLRIYEEAQRIIVEDVLAINIWQAEELICISPNLRGFRNFPIGTPRLWHVYLN